jgi:hypothetical protein
MFGTIWWLLTCGCVRKKKKKYAKRKVPKKGCCFGLCCSITVEDIRRLSPSYKRADEYAQFFLASSKGAQLRRLMVKLGCKRNQVTRMFKLFMKIDEDDSGMITLDEVRPVSLSPPPRFPVSYTPVVVSPRRSSLSI